jgi:hypothetical protein
LDFYLIADNEPNYSYKKPHLGSIDYEQFELLKSSKVISNTMDFYSDLRWGSQDVLLIHKRVEESNEVIFKKFRTILKEALDNHCGLMAIGD